MYSVAHGQLLRDGKPFLSVGFNYHPSPTGCQYWQKWDGQRIREDLSEMSRRGFNTVRFFIFWADFEPVQGFYDEEKINHLVEFVAIAREKGLCCIPSLLTIWMNGQLLDLPWRRGRNLWTDSEMLTCERNFVALIAAALKGADNILAYDLGDEILHVDPAGSQSLPDAVVRDWLHALTGAVRAADPHALVMQANESSAVTGRHAFRPENSQALDLIAIHGYPVWSPFVIESIASYKASCFVPFLVKLASAYGCVLVDELGSYGGDDQTARVYLSAVSHSALVNGARGTLVWAWQDFATTDKPYDLRPDERFVGVVDKDGHARPSLGTFQAFAREASTKWARLSAPPAPIGVYVAGPRAASPQSYLHGGGASAAAWFYSYLLLKRAHLPFEFTNGDLARFKMILCPSMSQLTLTEQEQLADYVSCGGVLYYSTADYLNGFGGEVLFGVRLKDFTLKGEEMNRFACNGREYPIVWGSDANRTPQIPVLEATRAEVLATFPNGTPALTRHALGRGMAFYLNAPFESQLNVAYRLDVAPWHLLYDQLAQAAQIERELDTDVPEIELATLCGEGESYGFIINHAPHALDATIYLRSGPGQQSTVWELRLEAGGVQVIRRADD